MNNMTHNIKTNILMYQSRNYNLNRMIQITIKIPEIKSIVLVYNFLFHQVLKILILGRWNGFELIFYDNRSEKSCVNIKRLDNASILPNTIFDLIIKEPELLKPKDNFILYFGTISVGLMIATGKNQNNLLIETISDPIQIGLRSSSNYPYDSFGNRFSRYFQT
jgi:hypothetical protein